MNSPKKVTPYCRNPPKDSVHITKGPIMFVEQRRDWGGGGGGGQTQLVEPCNIELTDGNTSIERYSNATKSNISLDLKTDQEALRLMLGASTDTDTNTFIECNNATGGTTVLKPTYFKDTINYEAENLNVSILIIQDLQFTNQQQTPVML